MTTPDEMCQLKPELKILGFGIYQTWSAIYMLNKILNDNLSIRRVVEIGSCSGGLAVLLGMIMKDRGGKTMTFDIVDPHPNALSIYPAIDVEFVKQDVFLPETVEMVGNFIKGERALIFCDGGLKKREFDIYSEIAKPSDLVMAHDWLAEIFKEDLTDRTLGTCSFFRQTEMDRMGTKIVSMIKEADFSPSRIQANKARMYR